MSAAGALIAALAIASAGGWLPAASGLAGGSEQTGEVIAEVRFRGNYSIPDEVLLDAAGVTLGEALTAPRLEAIERRLSAVEGVAEVEILKRYKSMSNTGEVVLLVNVHEHEAIGDKFMWFPLLTWNDAYGVTFGATFATVDLLGFDERLSFPLSWGGERRAAAAASFDLDNRMLSRLDAEFGIVQRQNPHFEIADRRLGGKVTAARRWDSFELKARARAETVAFNDGDHNQIEWGVGGALDTRQDVQLPRDAVYLGAAWDRLLLLGENRGINRATVDVRGYKTFVGRTIVAARAYYRGADAPLPNWEKPFLGAATVRGYDAGESIGDNIALLSAEWRVPLTPPLPVGLVGLNFFFDSGTVYDYGTALGSARFKNGVGGGIYCFVAFVGLQVDVAYGLDSDEVHFHFSTGFRF